MKAGDVRKRALCWLARGWRASRVLALAILVASGSLTYWFGLRTNQTINLSETNVTTALRANMSDGSPRTAPKISPAAANPKQPHRAVYPYSIVPGGIANVAELKSAIAKDYVVFDHYSTFRLDRARIVHLEHDRFVHVSYRIGDRVYWTKRILKLTKGETLITDGEETARTRCGNMISKSLDGPVSPNEPTEEELNTPAQTPHPTAELVSDNRFPELAPPPPVDAPLPSYAPPPLPEPSVASTPWSGGGSHLFIPLPEPTPRRRSTGPPTPPPVVSTPEPGTAIQFLLAVVVIVLLRKRKAERRA